MARPRIEDAYERLLASGIRLFAQRGTERVNSNAIAKRARLGVGTFYAHFADKYALLREIRVRTLDGLRRVRLEAIDSAGPDPEAQVRAAVGAAVAFAEAHPEAYRVSFGGERAGVVNPDFDKRFLDNLVSDPIANTSLTHTDFIREAGSEGIEMIMWNVMRGALDEDVREVYRLYHIPVSATAYGAIILENS